MTIYGLRNDGIQGHVFQTLERVCTFYNVSTCSLRLTWFFALKKMVLQSLPPPVISSLYTADRDRQGSKRAGSQSFWIKGWIQQGAHSTPKGPADAACYSNRDVPSKTQFARCTFRKIPQMSSWHELDQHMKLLSENSLHNRTLFPWTELWKSGVLTNKKEDLKAHNSFSQRHATKTATACVLLGCLARKGEGSRHQGVLEATCPNKCPLAVGAFFTTYKLHFKQRLV